MKPLTETDKKIIALCRQNRKLEAVKLYKDASGKGLYEAKMYVEQLTEATHKTDVRSGNFDDQLLQLCKNGDRLKAVKLYVETRKTDLKTAVAYIDQLQQNAGIGSVAGNANKNLFKSFVHAIEDRIFRPVFAAITGDRTWIKDREQ